MVAVEVEEGGPGMHRGSLPHVGGRLWLVLWLVMAGPGPT